MRKTLAFGLIPAVLAAPGLAGSSAGAAAGVAGVRAARAGAQATGKVPAVRTSPGARLWVARYHGRGFTFDSAFSVAVSPSGSTVYVTGQSGGAGLSLDYATVAYDAATGKQLWVGRYHGPGSENMARAVAVSPDGSAVYVTGQSFRSNINISDFATVAYNAATGTQLWVRRYHGPGSGGDAARAVAVSPDGSAVYVTGDSSGSAMRNDAYATVAYNAATGRQLWGRRYYGSGNDSSAHSVAVSPGGGTVYVTGQSSGSASGFDYATVAYQAATGRQLWVRRYNGPGNGDDIAYKVTADPSGTAIFVTGSSDGGSASGYDYATVAYSAATGRQLWVSRYNGALNRTDQATYVAVSPDGAVVYVTGESYAGPALGSDYATVAYDAATGKQLWVSRHGRMAPGATAFSMAVSPNGSAVYVTGEDYGGSATFYDYATVAYNAATGTQLWIRHYNGPLSGFDTAYSVAVSPRNGTIFVTGASQSRSDSNYATIAYHS